MSALDDRHDEAKLPQPRTTQAAEGLRRRPFTVAEIRAFVEAGLIDEDERFELIGGEIVPMSPKGLRHERVKSFVNEQLVRSLPGHLATTPETTFTLSDDTFLEPDFVVYERTVGLQGLNGGTCLLAIEISDTSLGWDRGRKAGIYASFGVAELWVVDAMRLETRVHRQPSPTGYREVFDVTAATALDTARVPGLALRLADIDPPV
ncbi:Uma2 family endonuclease [Lutibaculum baratangense]|uniref:Putative restriction endonuclease domain-containing protein n=1 Tax=Lutibaculum baratangense AMV1 TaxID=631454 RepID=V4R4R7_9HYPH|nr:Uma2 family endonuclease [Lutibaculum baratangense]ESR26922.1 hypothetical protein N177_0706 [Lutibaculum baratangense AMV1]